MGQIVLVLTEEGLVRIMVEWQNGIRIFFLVYKYLKLNLESVPNKYTNNTIINAKVGVSLPPGSDSEVDSNIIINTQTAMEERDRPDLKEQWWNTNWFQLTMLIAAVVGIISGAFYFFAK